MVIEDKTKEPGKGIEGKANSVEIPVIGKKTIRGRVQTRYDPGHSDVVPAEGMRLSSQPAAPSQINPGYRPGCFYDLDELTNGRR